MIDMSNDWANLTAKLITDITMLKKEPPPKVFMASMLNIFSKDMALFNQPMTMLEHVAQNIVCKLLVKFKFKETGVRLIRDLPIRNTNVFEHSFETEAGEAFYAIQVGRGPVHSVVQLTCSILEMRKATGCMFCDYRGFDDEGEECQTCRNGLVRKTIAENPGIKTFRNFGWGVFSRAIGDDYSGILSGFATEYLAFHLNGDSYLAEAVKLAESHRTTPYLLGDLYGKETESQLLEYLTGPHETGGEGEFDEEMES